MTQSATMTDPIVKTGLSDDGSAPCRRGECVVLAYDVIKRVPGNADAEPILRGCSLDIPSACMTAIVGPSGAGKTSLLYCLSGLDAPDSGCIDFLGRNPYAIGEAARSRLIREQVGFVFQGCNLVPYLTAEENAVLPLRFAGRRVDGHEVAAALERFGLSDKAHVRAAALSGGEQQRVSLVRALLKRPAVVFADEPTGALDTKNSVLVLDVLREMADAGAAVVIVTHDPDAAARADRVAFLRDGVVTHVDSAPFEADGILAGMRVGGEGRR